MRKEKYGFCSKGSNQQQIVEKILQQKRARLTSLSALSGLLQRCGIFKYLFWNLKCYDTNTCLLSQFATMYLLANSPMSSEQQRGHCAYLPNQSSK